MKNISCKICYAIKSQCSSREIFVQNKTVLEKLGNVFQNSIFASERIFITLNNEK